MTPRLRVLNVANKGLPRNDYRVAYGRLSRVADVVYALPSCPEGVDRLRYVHMGFREGVALQDIAEFVRLTCHLWRHRHEYDLVHFFSTKLQLAGPLCARIAGVPCISTITGLGRTFNRQQLRYRLLRPVYLMLLRVASRCAAATLFQNRGDMHWLAELLPGCSHKMLWIGSGAACPIVTTKDFKERPLRVLMVGRLMPDKGVRIFLDAAELTSRRFQFTMAGPPSAGQERLHAEVLHAHAQGSISFLGELQPDDLARVYREHHVFVLPSSGEGLSRAMLEAGHALLCPIASDIPANRDLIAPGRGLFLAADDPARSLMSHLERLAADPALLEENARAFQMHVLGTYNMQGYAQRMDDHLRRVIAGRSHVPLKATVESR